MKLNKHPLMAVHVVLHVNHNLLCKLKGLMHARFCKMGRFASKLCSVAHTLRIQIFVNTCKWVLPLIHVPTKLYIFPSSIMEFSFFVPLDYLWQ